MEVEMDGVGELAPQPNRLIFRIQPNEGSACRSSRSSPGWDFQSSRCKWISITSTHSTAVYLKRTSGCFWMR